ncbi:hypothetical protein [Schumannella luteola]
MNDIMELLGPTVLSIALDDVEVLPERTAVVVGVVGNYSWRRDSAPLPGFIAAEDTFVRRLVRCVAGYPRPDAIVIALIIEGEPDESALRLQSAIAREAHRYGIHLIESFYINREGWGSLACSDPGCALTGPLELDLLRERAEELRD